MFTLEDIPQLTRNENCNLWTFYNYSYHTEKQIVPEELPTEDLDFETESEGPKPILPYSSMFIFSPNNP